MANGQITKNKYDDEEEKQEDNINLSRVIDLDSIHFHSLYPNNQSNEEFHFQKQQAIGICVNFNFEPDEQGNTLDSILRYYTILHQYILILTPKSFKNFNQKHIQLFEKYRLININIDQFIFSKNQSIYYIECLNQRSGQLQHKCLLLCAQFYEKIHKKNANLRGILYLADDLYFNFAYVFSHPERFSLDEVWTTPWMQKLNLITNDKSRRGNRWWWWKNKPHFWTIYKNLFSSKSNFSRKYKQIFEHLYGSNQRLGVGIADLLYLPFADNQLNNFISISKYFIKILPSDIFCEIIFSLIVDTTMAISQHWPVKNDRDIFNSSINRLNNQSIIEQMEANHLIKSPRNPYSKEKSYRERPCLFNPDGYIWGTNRDNQQLYSEGIFNGSVPLDHLLKPWPFRTEFLHPMKLSNRKHWFYHLWHQGMNRQIQQLTNYQLNRTKIF